MLKARGKVRAHNIPLSTGKPLVGMAPAQGADPKSADGFLCREASCLPFPFHVSGSGILSVLLVVSILSLHALALGMNPPSTLGHCMSLVLFLVVGMPPRKDMRE